MAKQDSVKIIDLTKSNRTAQLVSAAAGALVGAGSASAVLSRLRDHDRTSTVIPAGEEQPTASVSPFDEGAAGVDGPKGIKGKALGMSERRGWGWLGRTLQVQQRYGELNGNFVASAVTLQIFLSIFPLFLVAAAVIGFVASGSSTDVAQRIVDSMGLTGSAAETLRSAVESATKSRKAGSVVGLVTLAWSALGVAAAIQYAYNQAWQSASRGLKDKAVGAVWLAGASFLFVASALITTLLNWLPAGVGIAGSLGAIVLTFCLWMFTAKLLPNVNVGWRSAVPGAILGTIGLELLKFAGAVWVPKAAASSSSLYGTIGIVFAVLAWMLLFGKLVMYSAVLNVVMHEGEHGVATASIEVPKPARPDSGVTRSGVSKK